MVWTSLIVSMALLVYLMATTKTGLVPQEDQGTMMINVSSSPGNSLAQTIFIYTICIVLIYLILSCLYESFLIPLAVILSVPFGLMGSFLFAKIAGLENNIYLQTGAIMLIGLLAKYSSFTFSRNSSFF